jgi:ligand-binding SRPBCC domain-containing protein
MPPFVFRAEQFVPRPLAEVFDFFSKAQNLQELTPAFLHFRILSVDPSPVRKGTLIKYSLRWRIFPIRWTTEITEWEPPYRFVDLQLKGPYKLWHHEHRFVAEGNGTRIIDEVQYQLPFGIFGSIAHSMKVKKDVETIFAYRTEVVRRLFES